MSTPHGHVNVVVLRGCVSSEPRTRQLPSGGTVTQVEVTTRHADQAASVPVVVHDRAVDCDAGDEVVVVGEARRRFFRAGGVTQSRTEVVASAVVRVTRRRAAARVVDAALERARSAA